MNIMIPFAVTVIVIRATIGTADAHRSRKLSPMSPVDVEDDRLHADVFSISSEKSNSHWFFHQLNSDISMTVPRVAVLQGFQSLCDWYILRLSNLTVLSL